MKWKFILVQPNTCLELVKLYCGVVALGLPEALALCRMECGYHSVCISLKFEKFQVK